jgi:hypothetical protein
LPKGEAIGKEYAETIGEARTVTCPQGHTTCDWTPSQDAKKNPVIHVRFARSLCAESRLLCTHAAKGGRNMTLRATQTCDPDVRPRLSIRF